MASQPHIQMQQVAKLTRQDSHEPESPMSHICHRTKGGPEPLLARAGGRKIGSSPRVPLFLLSWSLVAAKDAWRAHSFFCQPAGMGPNGIASPELEG